MNQLIQEIKSCQFTKQQFSNFCNKYLVKQYKVETISTLTYTKMQNANKIVNKSESYWIEDYKVKKWYPNQLKLYVWTILNYCMIHSTKIQELNFEDFQYIQSIFPSKTIDFLIYMSKNLLKESNNPWELDQVNLFKDIMTQYSDQKPAWNDISIQLYFDSNKKYFRAPRKCRQFWFNHLNPNINKQQWIQQQELILIKNIQSFGFRWSQLAKILNTNRTQHMIKNRVNWLIQKERRGRKKYNPINLLRDYRERLKRKIKRENCKKQNSLDSLANVHQKIQAEIISYNYQILQKTTNEDKKIQGTQKKDINWQGLTENDKIKTESTLLGSEIDEEETLQKEQIFDQQLQQLSDCIQEQDDKGMLQSIVNIQQYLNL